MLTQAPEIKALILEWYRRIEAGEMEAAAEGMLSGEQGFLAIGTDETEWIEDRGSILRAYTETANLGPPVINIQHIQAYREGTVAWAADSVVMKRPNDPAKTMRHTFVLHQEGSQWKVVHAHYSFANPE